MATKGTKRSALRKRIQNRKLVRVLNYILVLLIVLVLFFVGLIMYSVFFEAPVPRSPEEREYYLALDLVKKNPNNAYYLQRLARAEADLGKHEDAIEHLNKAAKLAPKRPMTHYYLGLIYLKIGNERKALEEFQKELEVTDQMNELAWYEIGKLYWKVKRYEDAEKAFKFALNRAPGMADVRLDLAKMYIEWGKKDLAKKELLEVLRYDPTSEEARTLMVEIGAVPGVQEKKETTSKEKK